MFDEEYVRALEARITELDKENKLLKKDNQDLLERVKKLEAKLNGYDNANTPSSRKPSCEKQTQASQEPAKQSGRSEGHEGVGRKTPEEVHETKQLEPVEHCPHCGKRLHFKGWRTRTITRLVAGWLENIRYLIPVGVCENCGESIEPRVPNALPNSRFDLAFALWVACLRMLGVSIDKVRFLLQTDYGLHVSSATIVNTCNKLAEFLGEDYEQLRKELLKEKRAHGDETGWPVKGKSWWLWEFISRRIAYFTVRKSRGQDVPEQVMNGFKGLFNCDFYHAYNSLDCEKQRCWVHLQRELDWVSKYKSSTEFAEFACQLQTLYLWAKSMRNRGSKTRVIAEAELRELVSQEYENGEVLRLVKRLKRHGSELFVFCSRRGAEKDNNHAEQGIRPAVVVRKTSFGSQSEQGADATATLMSFFQTARLRDENFIDFVRELVENRLQN